MEVHHLPVYFTYQKFHINVINILLIIIFSSLSLPSTHIMQTHIDMLSIIMNQAPSPQPILENMIYYFGRGGPWSHGHMLSTNKIAGCHKNILLYYIICS